MDVRGLPGPQLLDLRAVAARTSRSADISPGITRPVVASGCCTAQPDRVERCAPAGMRDAAPSAARPAAAAITSATSSSHSCSAIPHRSPSRPPPPDTHPSIQSPRRSQRYRNRADIPPGAADRLVPDESAMRSRRVSALLTPPALGRPRGGRLRTWSPTTDSGSSTTPWARSGCPRRAVAGPDPARRGELPDLRPRPGAGPDPGARPGQGGRGAGERAHRRARAGDRGRDRRGGRRGGRRRARRRTSRSTSSRPARAPAPT